MQKAYFEYALVEQKYIIKFHNINRILINQEHEISSIYLKFL